MMAEGGVPALLGLFCEVDAAMLAVTYVALALHEVSGILDIAYADGRREVTPFEQYVHGFLGRVPDDGDLLADRLALGPGAGCYRAPRATRLEDQAETAAVEPGIHSGKLGIPWCAGRVAVCRGTGAVRTGRTTPIGNRSCLTPP